jgi:hypothetical protein
MLGAFGEHLAILELEREIAEESLSIEEFIELLALRLPLLECLTLRNSCEMVYLIHRLHNSQSNDRHQNQAFTAQALATSLSAFPRLTSVSLPLPGSNSYMGFFSRDRHTQLASRLFRSSLSLKRIRLPTSNKKGIWYARSGSDAIVADVAEL